ncbi:hypothetical protein K450DRAFT_220038 [Umbelopsis ramanniana AG]|uniref:Uncharacterized protein n=1 Tax=Umbelopsis ramanniana AG TaxID=1314678 RepID=A0AAD5HIL1_UMBRA|nr:uncharacterized protein K450DRAFT_220038 [Umbelopsis ramanniana AG]KAI8583801.1 hypothetical protein K450DRAFT_220038 [Umbelopsis ramanniana AG]
MEKRQDPPSPGSGTPPSNFDIPTTIVLYTCVLLVAIGMCFCLQRANRLLPNGLNFALQPTRLSRSRSRGGAASFPDDDLEAQQGLLDVDDDSSDIEEEAYRRRQEAMARDEQEQEFEEFGELQEAPTVEHVHNDSAESPSVTSPQSSKKASVFSIQDDDEANNDEDLDRR